MEKKHCPISICFALCEIQLCQRNNVKGGFILVQGFSKWLVGHCFQVRKKTSWLKGIVKDCSFHDSQKAQRDRRRPRTSLCFSRASSQWHVFSSCALPPIFLHFPIMSSYYESVHVGLSSTSPQKGSWCLSPGGFQHSVQTRLALNLWPSSYLRPLNAWIAGTSQRA